MKHLITIAVLASVISVPGVASADNGWRPVASKTLGTAGSRLTTLVMITGVKIKQRPSLRIAVQVRGQRVRNFALVSCVDGGPPNRIANRFWSGQSLHELDVPAVKNNGNVCEVEADGTGSGKVAVTIYAR